MLQRLILAVALAADRWSQPGRTVSTLPSITETLFALDLGPELRVLHHVLHVSARGVSVAEIGYSKPEPEELLCREGHDKPLQARPKTVIISDAFRESAQVSLTRACGIRILSSCHQQMRHFVMHSISE